MTEKLFHKGWLYERDGVKFAPFTLKENIVDREGKTGWAGEVDSKLLELEDALIYADDTNNAQFENLKERTENLEIRTQYMNAEESDEFYITDAEGNVGFKVDDGGASSIDFTTSTGIKLSEVKANLDREIEDRIALGDALLEDIAANQNNIAFLKNRAQVLEIRTQFMNAEESDTFYITDGEGNIGLKVNNSGTTSYNFITNKTDLNTLADRTEEIEDTIASIQGQTLVNLQNQIINLQQRTKYMDASQDSSAFYVTDGKGNIAAIIDGRGITSFNFISHGVTDLNSLYRELKTHGVTINQIQDELTEIHNDINKVEHRATSLEMRTRYMDASTEDDTFYITDKNGAVGFKVDNNGASSIDFITASGIKLSEVKANLDKEIADRTKDISDLVAKDNELSDTIDDLNTEINNRITEVNNSLDAKMDTTKENLQTEINLTKNELNGTISDLADRLDAKDEEFSDALSDLTPRMVAVETRTQFMDASIPDAFYITDENGNIGFVFDSNGVLSTLYRMKATDGTTLPLIGYQKTTTITID